MARLTNEEIEEEISKVKGLSAKEKEILLQKSEATWFKQYGKKSRKQLRKIISKVKKGIKQGKYTYAQKPSDDKRGFIMPKVKKSKKGKKPVAQKSVAPKKKLSRKEKVEVQQIVRRAPSGRVYSKTELREGVNSKRAREYRVKNSIPVNDFSKMR